MRQVASERNLTPSPYNSLLLYNTLPHFLSRNESSCTMRTNISFFLKYWVREMDDDCNTDNQNFERALTLI